MRWSLALVAAAALAGCDTADEAGSSTAREPARPFQVKDDVGVRRVTQATAPQAANEVSLLPDGLVAGGAAKGAKLAVLRFGDGEVQVLRALTDRFDAPRQSENRKCEAGPMRFADFGAVRVNFIEGRFVGWFAESGNGLKTGEGMGPDWPYSRLERIGASPVTGSTLEGEFTLARPGANTALGGFTDKSGKVVSLYGGTNCFFR